MQCTGLEIREVFVSRSEADRRQRLRHLAQSWLRAVARRVRG